MTRLRLGRVSRDGLDDIAPALRTAGLPLDGLAGVTAIYRLEDEAGTIGWAALETHGRAALLRSVVIAEGRRGSGAGMALVRAVIDEAAADGIGELWLLTETAAPFFARLGFTAADRSAAPPAMQATSEFASICPVSATCMMMKLAP